MRVLRSRDAIAAISHWRAKTIASPTRPCPMRTDCLTPRRSVYGQSSGFAIRSKPIRGSGLVYCGTSRSVSPAFATSIPLSTEGGVAVVGAFDVVDAGSTAARNRSARTGYYGATNNSSPAFAAGSSGAPAAGGSGPSIAAAGHEIFLRFLVRVNSWKLWPRRD